MVTAGAKSDAMRWHAVAGPQTRRHATSAVSIGALARPNSEIGTGLPNR
jgi:hypothetical protein